VRVTAGLPGGAISFCLPKKLTRRLDVRFVGQAFQPAYFQNAMAGWTACPTKNSSRIAKPFVSTE
jgi:hypothetical protein